MGVLVAPAPVVERRLNLVQGEHYVTNDPTLVLTTLLGSCVAACLCDTVMGVGGMNHFLLPGEELEGQGSAGLRHGVHAMEMLVNGLLQQGARRERLQAKLFGGARMLKGLTDVGLMNAEFAKRFVQRERIALTGGSLKGEQGRRVQFWPTTGRARQMALTGVEQSVFGDERQAQVSTDHGSVELF